MSATATQIATVARPVSQAPSPQVPREGLRAAEDRGFEPRRAVKANRISSAAPSTGLGESSTRTREAVRWAIAYRH